MKKYILLALLFSNLLLNAQDYVPSPQNQLARNWFDSARFGMFIHWGASSVLGNGEWVMNNRNIRVPEYQRLIHIFNPIAFAGQQWVKTAQAAGRTHITRASRHQNGIQL